IVCCDPLDHLTGSHACARSSGCSPSSYTEINVEVIAACRRRSFRYVAYEHAGVEHVVVERKVAYGQPIQTRLPLPSSSTELGSDVFELLARRCAFPVLFECKLELTLCANAGKTEIVYFCHAFVLST